MGNETQYRQTSDRHLQQQRETAGPGHRNLWLHARSIGPGCNSYKSKEADPV
jgi:3-deoxy-D-manno-octulosonic-acid transferase